MSEPSTDTTFAETASPTAAPDFAPRLVLRAGIGAWCCIGIVAVLLLAAAALAAVSSVVMPLLFAAVLAVIFRPAAEWLEQRRFPPPLAAGTVVIGLVLLVVTVVIAASKGIIDQTDRLGDMLAPAADRLGVDAATAGDIRDALGAISPAATEGFVKSMISGISTIGGFAAGAVLAVLIMYYLLKDGAAMRVWAEAHVDPSSRPEFSGFLDDATSVLRRYARGRTVLSAIVAGAVGAAAFLLGLPLVLTLVVVNFVGGYVPYIGAVVGGGLAVLVALAEGSVPDAVAMLVVILAANLLLENFVEPKVMGRSLDVHPVVVLIVTATGGIVGGLVGLVMAVPIAVMAMKAYRRALSVDALNQVTGRAIARIAGLRQADPAPTRSEPER